LLKWSVPTKQDKSSGQRGLRSFAKRVFSAAARSAGILREFVRAATGRKRPKVQTRRDEKRRRKELARQAMQGRRRAA